jgi:hypothetical protein
VQRRSEPVSHEFDVTLGGLAGNLELRSEDTGVGMLACFDFSVKPQKTLVDDL